MGTTTTGEKWVDVMKDRERKCTTFMRNTTRASLGFQQLCDSVSAAGGSGRPWAPFELFLLCAVLLGIVVLA